MTVHQASCGDRKRTIKFNLYIFYCDKLWIEKADGFSDSEANSASGNCGIDSM